MSIEIKGKKIYRTINIPNIDEFPELLKKFHKQKKTANTKELENKWTRVPDGKFLTEEDVKDLIDEVTEWGKISRVKGGIYKGKHTPISHAFNESIKQLREKNIKDALETLRDVKGIGLSTATKILRFLCPEQCPVLDSILRTNLAYQESAEEYESFRSDLKEIQKALRCVENPIRDNTNWYLADIEAAIFMYFRKRYLGGK